MSIKNWQRKYFLNGLLISPVLPFLYLQGQYTRFKVGRLPDAQGETSGEIGNGGKTINFLAIGESTIAGVGAKDHKEALTGQFAKFLSEKTGAKVRWHALGVSGITIRRTIDELIPRLPAVQMDKILVGLGGNDVFGLSTPKKFRSDMIELLTILRQHYPAAQILLANVPMVRDFIALPNPTRYILSRVAKMHHFNARELISRFDNVYYYDPQGKFTAEHFSDGIHPSAHGYKLWAEEMINSFSQQNAF